MSVFLSLFIIYRLVIRLNSCIFYVAPSILPKYIWNFKHVDTGVVRDSEPKLMVHGFYEPEQDSLRLLPGDTWIDVGDFKGNRTLKDFKQTRKHCVLAMFPAGRQTRKHCFLAMLFEGGQTRKHCFPVMFPEGEQTRKHCFLAMFPEGQQSRKHCFLAMLFEGGQTRNHCFLAMFPEGGQTWALGQE